MRGKEFIFSHGEDDADDDEEGDPEVSDEEEGHQDDGAEGQTQVADQLVDNQLEFRALFDTKEGLT